MFTNFLVIVAFVIVAIANLVSDKRENQEGIFATKPLLMPLLALYYVMSASDHNWLIVFALLCGFLGDVFLMWPENKVFFGAGLAAFLVGHILYALTFLQSTLFLRGIPTWFYLLIIPYLCYCFILLKKLYPYVKSYVIPVVIYMFGIMIMSFSSLSRIWVIHDLAFWLPFIGSLFFIVSDSVLSIETFIVGKRTPNGEVIIMSTYILAELLIVLGFLV